MFRKRHWSGGIHFDCCWQSSVDGRSNKLGVAVLWLAAFSCGPSELCASKVDESSETFRFLRVSGSEFVKECEIQLRRSAESLVVTSSTQRGKQRLTITSRFDSKDVLRSAKVTIQRGKHRQSATVSINHSTARVLREGKETNDLACPPGIIVTSAPDWTDSFMAVRRYDPAGDTTQEFPGLWIHPTREPLQLTLKLTHLGHESVKHRNKAENLDRYLLVLRGGSRYVVWRNQQRQLVRLVPATSGKGGIVLAGWQQATRELNPRLSQD